MNEILTRTKQTFINICWEPFATSTPLKAVPPNINVERVPQTQLLLTQAPINIVDKLQNGFTNSKILQNKSPGSNLLYSNKTRKNTSSYFDVLTTSSSDEDESSENKKRPIIKLTSRRKTRSLLSVKKLACEETETVNKINPENKINDCKKLKSTNEKYVIPAVTDYKHTISQPSNGKGKAQYSTKGLHSSFKNDNLSADEENKIFDETKDGKPMSSFKSCSRNKENIAKILNTEILGKSVKQGLKQASEKNGISATSNKGIIFEEEKGSCKTVFEDYKVPKVPKKRCKKITSTIYPVKRTRSRKVPEELPAENLQSLGNTEIPPHVSQKKHNLSHQLFSDSREQEFINMLDLTREENNEGPEAMKSSVQERENDIPLRPFVSPHPSIENVCTDENKQGRPKRTRQKPKNYWLPENVSDKALPIVVTNEEKNQMAKNNDLNQEAVVSKKSKQSNTSNKNPKGNKGADHASVKRQKCGTKGNRRVKSTVQEQIIESNNILNDDEVNLKDADQNCHPLPTTHGSQSEESNQNPFTAIKGGKRKPINLEKPVFQRLDELSYKRDKTGCSVKQCWNLNNFKCGVFRLKIKAQFTCKTVHKNSHLGGVLVKGELRMKIGDEDLHLKEGDMAFVPPLTKWQATNVGDCESIFYYWCGRFTT